MFFLSKRFFSRRTVEGVRLVSSINRRSTHIDFTRPNFSPPEKIFHIGILTVVGQGQDLRCSYIVHLQGRFSFFNSHLSNSFSHTKLLSSRNYIQPNGVRAQKPRKILRDRSVCYSVNMLVGIQRLAKIIQPLYYYDMYTLYVFATDFATCNRITV